MSKKVRIVAPSGVIDPSLVVGAAERLRMWGLDVVVGEHACCSYGRFAATEDERLQDLNTALCDDSTDFILCARGGYGLAQILDQVEVPADKVPTIIGFSDITALHCLMGTKGIPSIHAVMAKHLCEYDSHVESADALRNVLLTNTLEYHLSTHALSRQGVATGTLRGGNLSVLYGLQGTPYAMPVELGDILFIEDVGEHPYAIDRMMQNLRLSGVLAKLGGLVVGQFSDYEEDPRMPYTVYEGIRRMVEPYGYPVLMNFPAGHVERNLPLVINRSCTICISEAESVLKQ